MADDLEETSLPEYSAKWWMKEITEAEKYHDKTWRKPGDAIIDRYLDEREESPIGVSTASDESSGTEIRKYNMYWANVQIMKSALYAQAPKPVIKRQHDDAKDDVARTAALILERIIKFGYEADQSDIHAATTLAIEDLLIPGLGQVWLRYDVETEETEIPAQIDPVTGSPSGEATKGLRITDESATVDYVYWRDFIFPIIRTWNEKWWCGRRCWMKKKQFVKRFGKEKWDEVGKGAKSFKDDGKVPKGFLKNRAEVFEVWCEDSNKVYWVSRHVEELLDEKEDPLKLDNFYPCPAPVLATHTTNAFKPRADYTMVQDQYQELDTLNARIALLTKALRVVGVYNKDAVELKKLLSGGEFNMIPVDNWAAFAENGGIKGSIDWFPVEVIAEVLVKLSEQRVAVIGQIYELTSISDIMRGASNPRDTLGAQKLKAQYSSVRLQLRQQDVGKFVRETIRIKCEIICRHWQPETIKRVSQIDYTESAQYADQAIALLKDYKASEYRIEVGEETLSLADYNAERELRTEVLTAIGQFISQAAQMMEAYPAITPYLFKMIQWVISSFRGSSDIETVLDEAIKMAEQNPPKPQEGAPAKPDPAQAEGIKAQAALAIENASNASKEKIALHKDKTSVAVAEISAGTADQQLIADVTGEAVQRAHEAGLAGAQAAADSQEAEATRAHASAEGEATRAASAEQAKQAAKAKGKS